jgi:hypothetical protein
MPIRTLDSLDIRFRFKAIELLARCTEAGVPVLIINTLRTQAEQDEAIRTGHSKVARSKHQDGLAIDICPIEQFLIHKSNKLQWDINDPVWKQIGEIGQKLGLRWGGTFKPLNQNGLGWDPGHFEYVEVK